MVNMLDIWRSVVGTTANADLEYLCVCVFCSAILCFVFKGFYILLNKF